MDTVFREHFKNFGYKTAEYDGIIYLQFTI